MHTTRQQPYKMERIAYHILILTWLTCLTSVEMLKPPDNVVTPTCSAEASICRLKFVVNYNITMMKWIGNDIGGPDSMLPVITRNGTLYAKRKDCSGMDPLTEEDYETFLSGDGGYKRIMSINGKLPGTPIVVYKGQQVSVLVTNDMENEVMTLHWHGLHMRRTPWMDGTGGISHCPIQPRQSFEYRFFADNAGTFWYHGHIASQRTMGLAGHITVLEKSPQEENNGRGSDKLPMFDSEFHLMVSDWFKKLSDDEQSIAHSGNQWLTPGDNPNQYSYRNGNVDGTNLGWIPFYSAIINGKGQRFNPSTNKAETPDIPVETFTVKEGARHRFRIVNSGMHFAFKISIDQHMLYVIASDGSDVITTPVTHLVVTSGETYDVYIEAKDPDSSGNYWIRAETLEYLDSNRKRLSTPGHVEAILHYKGAKDVRPVSKPRPCTNSDKCIYLNCLSRFFPEKDNIECMPLISLRHPLEHPTLVPSDGIGFTEYILALDLTVPGYPSTINGKEYVPPTVPPQIYPKDSGAVKCDLTCQVSGCRCTHELELPKDHIIQLTFFSFNSESSPAASYHPMHIHGHHFQVVKMGWPVYNTTTGILLEPSQDIDCSNGRSSPDWCHSPKWADRSWENGNLPGIVKGSAPVKNTVLVPAGGYVVVRFKADNPGYWILHCHMELHQLGGMALIFKEGQIKDMPKVPRGFPRCGSFDWSSEEFHQKINSPAQPIKLGKDEEQEIICIEDTQNPLDITTIVLGVTLSVLTLANAHFAGKIIRKKMNDTKTPPRGLMNGSTSTRSSSYNSQERVPLIRDN